MSEGWRYHKKHECIINKTTEWSVGGRLGNIEYLYSDKKMIDTIVFIVAIDRCLKKEWGGLCIDCIYCFLFLRGGGV